MIRVAFAVALITLCSKPVHAKLSVGAAVVDVTPTQLPVLVNGGMLSKTAEAIKTRVNARAVVIGDGNEKIGIVVVDSCMLPRVLIDAAKQRAASRAGLTPDRILISATHTHSAPSAFAALGTEADPAYVPFIREKIAEALELAEAAMQPARVGWGSGAAPEFTALRRWVRRPDRLDTDPFGNQSVRANMHAAKDLEDVTGPSGPEDPELSIVAFESTDGRPIAALCNFSMHYFSDQPISADYFGLFCDGLKQHAESRLATSTDTASGGVARKATGATSQDRGFVGIMSHGCSGDIWRRDYMTWGGNDAASIDGYAQGLLAVATRIFDSIEYSDEADLEMAQAVLPMSYRTPDAQHLQWARGVVESLPDGMPTDRTEVYAREQLLLDQMQKTDIVIQAIRIGDIAIATTPNETYALTGLKLKLRSPLKKTMVIELANGADGYIPPPEQHLLGGYNTWPARSAGLEVTAEPRIVAASLNLLEAVTGKPRRDARQSVGPAAKRLLDAGPAAYWRLDEMEGPIVRDHSGHHRDGHLDMPTCFFLPGPQNLGFTGKAEVNRCVHFAGGRMRARLGSKSDSYTVVMHAWNGMPVDAREVSGWLVSRDHGDATSDAGEHLGVCGSGPNRGRLMWRHGSQEAIYGETELKRWQWYRIVIVREPDRVRVYLDDSESPEIDVKLSARPAPNIDSWFIGGRSDSESNWEGRIDEVAVFDRALAPTSLFSAER